VGFSKRKQEALQKMIQNYLRAEFAVAAIGTRLGAARQLEFMSKLFPIMTKASPLLLEVKSREWHEGRRR
jgi:hypothetical protein